jgi:LPXTG-motif cell wall-anchored protein
MEKKDSNIVILGITAILAILLLVFLFKQAMTGGYAYTDKLQTVPALE